jgi:CBS domain-containing protein
MNLSEIKVEDAMIPVPHVVTVDASLEDVVRHMIADRCDAVVVMRDADVAGVFTAVDGLRALASLLSDSSNR